MFNSARDCKLRKLPLNSSKISLIEPGIVVAVSSFGEAGFELLSFFAVRGDDSKTTPKTNLSLSGIIHESFQALVKQKNCISWNLLI